MSDFNSSLPVRTETNGDVVGRLVDGTITTQFLGIDAAGKIGIKLSDGAGVEVTSQANGAQQALDVGINVAGIQIDPRAIRALTAADVVTAEQGTSPWVVSATDLDIRDLDSATDSVTAIQGTSPWIIDGTVAATQSGTWTVGLSEDHNFGAVGANTLRTAAQLGNATGAAAFNNGATDAQTLRVAANLAIGGANVGPTNPVPVVISNDNVGDEINAYNTAAAIAGGASSNHDYTVTAGKTLLLQQIEASCSGRAKIEVQVETAVASGTFLTKFVQFNSTSSPNMALQLKSPISVAAGVRVRVIRTNRDLLATDVYSTISGQEV